MKVCRGEVGEETIIGLYSRSDLGGSDRSGKSKKNGIEKYMPWRKCQKQSKFVPDGVG